MRPDMGKCVIESPRAGHHSARSAKVRDYGKIIQDDEGYDYDGIRLIPVSRKQEGYHKKLGDKSFTDVLGPVEGYLRKACGRPWNDVYSEICRTLGHCGWAVEHIIKDHIDVETCTFRATDGSIVACNKYGESVIDEQTYRVGSFYVEPETGILREGKGYRRYRYSKPEDPNIISLGEQKELRWIAGVWYYTEYREFEVTTVKTYSYSKRRYSETGIVREVSVKRQLGKKELKRYGLRR